MLHVTNLYKSYKGIPVLKNISIRVEKGEVVGLLGPNGSGKTTLLKIIAGLSALDRGNIQFYNQEQSRIGTTIEGQSFLPSLSGFANLKLLCLYNEIPPERIEKVNVQFGMDAFLYRKYKTYSTGMKKKLDLACLFLKNNVFFLLDEPTNGLDLDGTISFKDIIRAGQQEEKTYMISSHISGHLEDLCNRFIFLQNGRLVKDIPKRDLLFRFRNLEEAYKAYCGSVPVN